VLTRNGLTRVLLAGMFGIGAFLTGVKNAYATLDCSDPGNEEYCGPVYCCWTPNTTADCCGVTGCTIGVDNTGLYYCSAT
jgi:hypothetical protein